MFLGTKVEEGREILTERAMKKVRERIMERGGGGKERVKECITQREERDRQERLKETDLDGKERMGGRQLGKRSIESG